MTRTRKEELVAEMTAEFKDAGAIIVCDYKGMTVENLEIVRNLAKDEDTKVKIDELIQQRSEAKKAKDFELSDKLRDEILACGVNLMDTPQGSFWEKL